MRLILSQKKKKMIKRRRKFKNENNYWLFFFIAVTFPFSLESSLLSASIIILIRVYN